MPTAALLMLPEHGHLPAALPLAAELVRRGERVVVWGTPAFREAIAATGAEYRVYAPEAATPPPAHTGGLYSVLAYVAGLTEAVLPALLPELELLRPGYLLIDNMALWGHLAAQVATVPAITLAPVFAPNPEIVTDAELLEQAYGQAPTPVLLNAMEALNTYLQQSQRLERRFGVRCPGLVEFFAGRQALNLLFTARSFHPAGERYGDGYAFVGPQLPLQEPALEAALLPPGSEPLIYLSQGTIFNQDPEFFRTCVAALGERRVALALGGTVAVEALGPLPATWVARPHWPQRAVLAQAALCVTHAGMNTTSEALWNGVPVLCLPQHGDQFLVAQQATAAGAGLTLPPGERSAAAIATAAQRLLDEPAFAAGAHRVQAELRAAAAPRGGAALAADLIAGYFQRRAAATP